MLQLEMARLALGRSVRILQELSTMYRTLQFWEKANLRAFACSIPGNLQSPWLCEDTHLIPMASVPSLNKSESCKAEHLFYL